MKDIRWPQLRAGRYVEQQVDLLAFGPKLTNHGVEVFQRGIQRWTTGQLSAIRTREDEGRIVQESGPLCGDDDRGDARIACERNGFLRECLALGSNREPHAAHRGTTAIGR